MNWMLLISNFDQQTAKTYQNINAGTDEMLQKQQLFKFKMFVNKNFNIKHAARNAQLSCKHDIP